MKNTFNETHPELQVGEMFLTNVTKSFGYINPNYNLIGYKSKRKGNVAFTIFGKIINDTYPVFIKISEFNKVQENYEHKKF